MIKRLLLSFLIFHIVIFNLFSVDYKSNILGQKLGPVDNNSEYVLSEEGNIRYLKKNNEIIKIITETQSEGFLILTEENLSSNSSTIKTYKNGLLVKKAEYSNNDFTEYTLNYVDGSLIFCTVRTNDEEPISSYYLKDSYEGRLIGKKSLSDYNLSGSGYLIENESLFRQITDTVVFKDNFSFDDEGNIVLKKDEDKYVYSSKGQLKNQNIKGVNTVYDYDDDNNLIQTETIKDNCRIIGTFENGKLIEESEYENDTLKSITRYTDSDYGMIKTIVKSGNNIADIYYDFDCIKILKIDYLN